jgi:GntR family transcriptional regulator, transcriptional repressor for pyruvate dehydrogenase complex
MNAEGTKKRAVETTADKVRSAILRGDIRAGSDLPGERGLAAELGVSRLTLRSALARLETEGLVHSVHGSGTRVLDFRETAGIDLIGYLAREDLANGTLPVGLLRDLLELRRMVAVELLGLVTERASDAELDALGAHLREQAKLLGDRARFVEADLQFARLVVRAGHNLALELLYNTVVRLIAEQPGIELAFLANAEQTLVVYQRLLELIAAREPRRVVRMARRILDRLDRATLARVAELLDAQRKAE